MGLWLRLRERAQSIDTLIAQLSMRYKLALLTADKEFKDMS